jgi:hypothetical protein
MSTHTKDALTPSSRAYIFATSSTPDPRSLLSTLSKRRVRDITPPSENTLSDPSETSDEESEDAPREMIDEHAVDPVPGIQPTSHTPVLPSPGSMEQVIWTTAVRAWTATQAAFDADPIQSQHVASTSNVHSYRPITRSETHRLALDREHLATS